MGEGDGHPPGAGERAEKVWRATPRYGTAAPTLRASRCAGPGPFGRKAFTPSADWEVCEDSPPSARVGKGEASPKVHLLYTGLVASSVTAFPCGPGVPGCRTVAHTASSRAVSRTGN